MSKREDARLPTPKANKSRNQGFDRLLLFISLQDHFVVFLRRVILDKSRQMQDGNKRGEEDTPEKNERPFPAAVDTHHHFLL